jgi:hypothetical protein
MSTERLVALGVVLVLGAGCGAHDRPGSQREQPSGPTFSDAQRDDCVTRADALIAARSMPRADRDYAIGMCLENR